MPFTSVNFQARQQQECETLSTGLAVSEMTAVAKSDLGTNMTDSPDLNISAATSFNPNTNACKISKATMTSTVAEWEQKEQQHGRTHARGLTGEKLLTTPNAPQYCTSNSFSIGTVSVLERTGLNTDADKIITKRSALSGGKGEAVEKRSAYVLDKSTAQQKPGSDTFSDEVQILSTGLEAASAKSVPANKDMGKDMGKKMRTSFHPYPRKTIRGRGPRNTSTRFVKYPAGVSSEEAAGRHVVLPLLFYIILYHSLTSKYFKLFSYPINTYKGT